MTGRGRGKSGTRRRRRGASQPRQGQRRGSPRNSPRSSPRAGQNLASSPSDSMTSNRSESTSGRRSRSASPSRPLHPPGSSTSTIEEHDSDPDGGTSSSSSGAHARDGSNSNQDTQCPICHNQISHMSITNCNHRFCRDCIRRWTSRHATCPSCRQTIRTIRSIRPNGTTEVRQVSRTEQIATRINETYSVMMVLFSLLVSLLPEVASYLEQMDEIVRELNLPTAAMRARAAREQAAGGSGSGSDSGPASASPSSSSPPLPDPSRPTTRTGGVGSSTGSTIGGAGQMRSGAAANGQPMVSFERTTGPTGSANVNGSRLAFRLRINRPPNTHQTTGSNPSSPRDASSGAGAASGGSQASAAERLSSINNMLTRGLLANSPFNMEAQARAADATDAGRRPTQPPSPPNGTRNVPHSSTSSSGGSLRPIGGTISMPSVPVTSASRTRPTLASLAQRANKSVISTAAPAPATPATTAVTRATTNSTTTTTTTATTSAPTTTTSTTPTPTSTTTRAEPAKTGQAQQTAKKKVSKIGDRNKQDTSQPRRSKKYSQNKKNAPATRNKEQEESSTNSKKDPGYQEIIGSLVASKFKLTKLLGSGSYGAVYLGKNIVTSEQVAVKLEHKATKAPQLPLEYRFIKMIGPVEGFPRIIRIDECAGTYHAMIMELLGPSLEEVFNICERRLGLKSVLYLTLQLIARFQTLHSKNIIYRDVKPENFLLGRPGMEKENIVHIIDYGLAKEYINPDSGTHIAFRGQRGAIGTARYMSVNTHLGKEQSRRDDLEALGYVIIYFMRGSLPWQGLPATDHRERMRKIGEMKRRLPVEEICERCPPEFASYLRYVKELDFYEAPDYDYLRKLFMDLFISNRFVEDGIYDWTGKFENKSS